MKMTKTPIYKSTKDGKVRVTMTLDPRKGAEREMPVCVRVRIVNLQRYFLMPNERYTSAEFSSVINDANRKMGPKRKMFDDFFDKIHREIKKMVEEGEFEPEEFLETLTNRINGIKKVEKNKAKTIYEVWEQLLKELEDANRIGTRNSYRDAFNRFKADMGEKVNNIAINQTFIDKWVTRMQDSSKGRAIGATTIGMYLRAFRVVVRRAAAEGVLIAEKMDIFKGVKDVNRRGERKERFLDVGKMSRLYDFFVADEAKDKDGNELFDPDYKKRLFDSLGIFLFSYLANGANLADLARLRYDDFYFLHGKQAMRFIRQKTMRETNGVEVIFPILPQMQAILDRIANEPKQGALVFNIIKESMGEERIRTIMSNENTNIAQRMEVLAELVGLEEKPTPTWCRHSYATNLRDAGIPTEYISTMMGHTITAGSATTLNYLSRYNMATMVANNSKLLSRNKQNQTKEALLNRLMEMDKERQEIMLKLMEQQ